MSVPELSGTSDVFYIGHPSRQPQQQQEYRRPYERRSSPAATPLESNIEEVLVDGRVRTDGKTGGARTPSVRSGGNRDAEPAYLRHGITIDTTPSKEGRTHVWTLDMDE